LLRDNAVPLHSYSAGILEARDVVLANINGTSLNSGFAWSQSSMRGLPILCEREQEEEEAERTGASHRKRDTAAHFKLNITGLFDHSRTCRKSGGQLAGLS
jgi:hypothetical protein